MIFDLFSGGSRVTYKRLEERVCGGFTMPKQIGAIGSISVEFAMRAAEIGWHGEVDPVEGCVWRVERDQEVDFLCKFVRPDKLDGKYLPEISGKRPVINAHAIDYLGEAASEVYQDLF